MLHCHNFVGACSALLTAAVMLCNWPMSISVNRSRSPASHAPPLRKKSRSVFLLGCKRPRNEKPSLPTFCGNAPSARWQEAFPSRERAFSFTCSALLTAAVMLCNWRMSISVNRSRSPASRPLCFASLHKCRRATMLCIAPYQAHARLSWLRLRKSYGS